MKRIFNAILFLAIFLVGSFSYAGCRVVGGYPHLSTDFVNGFYQNQHANIWENVEIECTENTQVEWFLERNDPDGWQQKVDLLLDGLEANPRAIHLYVKILPMGSSVGQSISEVHFNFGIKGAVVISHITSATTLKPGKYVVTVGASFNVASPKKPSTTLTRNDKRLLLTIGGLRVTYAFNFKADPAIPICDPKYKYYIDRTNISFNPIPRDYFDNGRSLQQDINFKVEREHDPDCNAEIVSPLIKINGPMGANVETPGITGTHIADLKNGTRLALYQIADSNAESVMNYGTSYDLKKIGGQNGLQSSRKARIRWQKTPGKSVKIGPWHATMKYELYFR